jgi:hypothetical protein
MHSTRIQKKFGAQESGLSESDPESPENSDTPGKSSDTPGFQNTSEKQNSSNIFNLAYSILRE